MIRPARFTASYIDRELPSNFTGLKSIMNKLISEHFFPAPPGQKQETFRYMRRAPALISDPEFRFRDTVGHLCRFVKSLAGGGEPWQ